MPKRVTIKAEIPETAIKPSLMTENKIQELGNLALNVAEQQLRDGSASSQVITYFLKAISERERLENERLTEENKKLRAQTEALQSAKHIEELYAAAMQVFKGYQGLEEDEEGY